MVSKLERLLEDEDIKKATGFDFCLIEPYARAVKKAISWGELSKTLHKVRKYFPYLKSNPV